MRPVERLALRVSLARARRVIAVSEAVRESALRLTAGKRLTVLSGGIDLARFERLPDRLAARRALALPEDARIVLCVARLSPEKGVDLLSESLRGEEVVLLVAGDGPERARLAEGAGGADSG